MLAGVAGVATLVFIAIASIVGIRLLLLARRTRGLPELSLGFGLLIIVGVGYPLALVGRSTMESSPDTARWLLALSALPVGLGWSGVWIFTWRVFRPDQGLAKRATLAALAAMAGLCVASMYRTLSAADPASIDFSSPVYTGTSLLAMSANLWATIEALGYRVKMRKRIAVGLGDPVVANRFLLWAVVMTSSMLSTAFPVVSTMMGINSVESPVVLVGSAVMGLVCSGALWLAFLPPKAYLARLRTA